MHGILTRSLRPGRPEGLDGAGTRAPDLTVDTGPTTGFPLLHAHAHGHTVAGARTPRRHQAPTGQRGQGRGVDGAPPVPEGAFARRLPASGCIALSRDSS
jgi:hypothetical protein